MAVRSSSSRRATPCSGSTCNDDVARGSPHTRDVMHRRCFIAAGGALVLTVWMSGAAHSGTDLFAAPAALSQAAAGRAGGPQPEAAEPAAIERGRLVYTQNCVFCHGADARGGAEGGADLT